MHGGQLRFEDDLTEIYRNNPIELLLGSWQSMRRAAARIARRMTSRIDAFAPLSAQGNDDPANVMLKVNAQKTDPLIGALGEGEGALELYGDPAWEERGRFIAWTSNHPAQKTKDTKKFKASEMGLGEVPAGSRGRWFPAERIRQTVSISLVGLRQEHFPLDGSSKPELDLAVQVAAASLGLLSYSLLRREGYFLRSGCSLVPKRSEALVVHPNASRTTLPIDLGADSVEKLDALYREAVDHVEKLGLSFATRAEPFDVDPELQELINKYGKTKPKVLGRDVTSESP
jgi:hypothetical protein